MFKSSLLASCMLAFCLLGTLHAENTGPAPIPSRAAFNEDVVNAHGAGQLSDASAISFRIIVDNHGVKIIDGEIIATPHLDQLRYEGVDGMLVVVNGPETYITPDDAPFPHNRDFIKIWPMLVTAPFQLDRVGYKVVPEQERPLEGIQQHTARLTFTPQNKFVEWALLYKNADSLLSAIAYQPRPSVASEAEPTTPSIVVFRKYDTVGNLRFPSAWEIYPWDEKTGIAGDKTGTATVTEIQFLEQDPRRFEKPNAEIKPTH